MIEIWKNIVGYEGLYQVSNFGRVKSLPRNTPAGMRGGKILNIEKSKNGYLRVNLWKNGKAKHFLVHRLVAEAFIPNPDNLPCVNHKNKQRDFNFVENLEWCTYEYNNNYEDHNELIAKSKYKIVYQFTLDGTFVREWPSVKEVQQQTGWSQGNISACCCGCKGFKSAYGYKWSYDKDFRLFKSDNSNLTSLPNC